MNIQKYPYIYIYDPLVMADSLLLKMAQSKVRDFPIRNNDHGFPIFPVGFPMIVSFSYGFSCDLTRVWVIKDTPRGASLKSGTGTMIQVVGICVVPEKRFMARIMGRIPWKIWIQQAETCQL